MLVRLTCIVGTEASGWSKSSSPPATGEAGDEFGFSVALSRKTALVGAVDVTDGGSAYVYHWDGEKWVEQVKLTASDGEAVDAFGVSVALTGATALVGASWDDVGGNTDAGSAYVFRWDP